MRLHAVLHVFFGVAATCGVGAFGVLRDIRPTVPNLHRDNQGTLLSWHDPLRDRFVAFGRYPIDTPQVNGLSVRDCAYVFSKSYDLQTVTSFWFEESGWPFRSFVSVAATRDQVLFREHDLSRSIRVGWFHVSPRRVTIHSYSEQVVAIPTRVTIFGFVANVLVFAVASLVLVSGPRAWQRRSRWKRARCPECGYPQRYLKHPTCPECGATFPTLRGEGLSPEL